MSNRFAYILHVSKGKQYLRTHSSEIMNVSHYNKLIHRIEIKPPVSHDLEIPCDITGDQYTDASEIYMGLAFYLVNK
jgi:hypothetical protein